MAAQATSAATPLLASRFSGYDGFDGVAVDATAAQKAAVTDLTKAVAGMAVADDCKDGAHGYQLMSPAREESVHGAAAAAAVSVDVVKVWRNFHKAAKNLSCYVMHEPIRDYSLAHQFATKFKTVIDKAESELEGPNAENAHGVFYKGLTVEISRLVNEIVMNMNDYKSAINKEGKLVGYIYSDDKQWATQAKTLLKALDAIKPKGA